MQDVKGTATPAADATTAAAKFPSQFIPRILQGGESVACMKNDHGHRAGAGFRHHPGRAIAISRSGDWPQCQRCERRRGRQANAHTLPFRTRSHLHTHLLTIPL